VAARAGCSGLIVPDIALQGGARAEYMFLAERSGIIPIDVISSVSVDTWLEKYPRRPLRGSLNPDLFSHVERIKRWSSASVAVGFGIRNADHVLRLRGGANIVVVGSAVLDNYIKVASKEKVVSVRNFISSLVYAIRTP